MTIKKPELLTPSGMKFYLQDGVDPWVITLYKWMLIRDFLTTARKISNPIDWREVARQMEYLVTYDDLMLFIGADTCALCEIHRPGLFIHNSAVCAGDRRFGILPCPLYKAGEGCNCPDSSWSIFRKDICPETAQMMLETLERISGKKAEEIRKGG